MDNSIFFYPRLDKQLCENSGLNAKDLLFHYTISNQPNYLDAKYSKCFVKLVDKKELWKLAEDGLKIERSLSFEYPQMLYGKNGIASKNADIGIAIIWSCRTLTNMGYIKPEIDEFNGGERIAYFSYSFMPGEVMGDLTLQTILYIRKSADQIDVDETNLMNEEGVIIGEIDAYTVYFDSMFMDFPIKEINDKNKSLWWLEITKWEDPTEDDFQEYNLSLYLNISYKSCPRIAEKTINQDMLIEIISSAFFQIIIKLEQTDYLDRTLNDIDLKPGSISKIMYHFINSCDPALNFRSPELLSRGIRDNVARLIGEEDEQ